MRARIGGIGFVLLALLLVAVSIPMRKYFDRPIALDKKNAGKELATLVEVEGPVFLRARGQTQFERLAGEEVIQNKDQLRVENGARAKVRFSSGTEIEILEPTDVVFELWQEEAEDSPLYLHFLSGDYRVISIDRARPIYVAMNDNLFLLQNKSKEAPRKLNIRQTPSALSRKAQESAESNEEIKPAAEVDVNGAPTNAYIDQTIAAQKSFFQKCQANSIRNKKQSVGQLVAGITILPSGQVSDAKLLSTNFKDLELPNCAIDVIRRIKFHAYTGEPIIRSYPLQFE